MTAQNSPFTLYPKIAIVLRIVQGVAPATRGRPWSRERGDRCMLPTGRCSGGMKRSGRLSGQYP